MSEKIVSLNSVKEQKKQQEKSIKDRLDMASLALLSESFDISRSNIESSAPVYVALASTTKKPLKLWEIFKSETLPLLIKSTGLSYKFSITFDFIDLVYCDKSIYTAAKLIDIEHGPTGITLVANINASYKCIGRKDSYHSYISQRHDDNDNHQKICTSIIDNMVAFAEENGWYTQILEGKEHYHLYMCHNITARNKRTHKPENYAMNVSLILDKQEYKLKAKLPNWLNLVF